MLKIKTYLAPSKIPGAGIGLFAAEKIPKDELIWEMTWNYDLIFHKEQIKFLDKFEQSFIKKHAFLDSEDMYVLCIDNDRFMNHSDTPNTNNKILNKTTALRDIKANEELTCNYYEFDLESNKKLNARKKKNRTK